MSSTGKIEGRRPASRHRSSRKEEKGKGRETGKTGRKTEKEKRWR